MKIGDYIYYVDEQKITIEKYKLVKFLNNNFIELQISYGMFLWTNKYFLTQKEAYEEFKEVVIKGKIILKSNLENELDKLNKKLIKYHNEII